MSEYKRLTARNQINNMAYLVNVKQHEQDVESPYPNTLRCIMDSFDRLAQYEDIGSPEEFAEFVKAKAEGRLATLPCKVGDTVYWRYGYRVRKNIVLSHVIDDNRPCMVKNRKALFHKWNDKQSIIEPSIMVGGHNGGLLKYTVGIIEYEDGVVTECYPHEIRFCDNKFREFCFPEQGK